MSAASGGLEKASRDRNRAQERGHNPRGVERKVPVAFDAFEVARRNVGVTDGRGAGSGHGDAPQHLLLMRAYAALPVRVVGGEARQQLADLGGGDDLLRALDCGARAHGRVERQGEMQDFTVSALMHVTSAGFGLLRKCW